MEGRVTTRTMLAVTVLQERILALFYPSGMLRNSKRKKKKNTYKDPREPHTYSNACVAREKKQ